MTKDVKTRVANKVKAFTIYLKHIRYNPFKTLLGS